MHQLKISCSQLIPAITHSSGTIKVHGKQVAISHPKDAVKHGIAYLSEDRKRFGLSLPLDVDANISMASMDKFSSGGIINFKKSRDNSNELVRQLSIKTPSLHQLVKFLSGGNQQKVVLAKWLTRNSDILIFDEPTRGIDVGAKSEIYKLPQSKH